MEKRYPKNKLPPAPFALTQEEKTLADKRLTSLRFPPGFGDIPETLFTRICGGVKSHTWYQLYTSGVIRFCLRRMLGGSQHRSLMNFLIILEQLYKSPTDSMKIDELEEQWHVALCNMERDFPLSLQSFVMHLLHHLPSYIKLYRLPSNFWMFSYERLNKTLGQSISNIKNPEFNAIKKMEVQWLVSMLDAAGYLQMFEKEKKRVDSLQYLNSGAYRPHQRAMSETEFKDLSDLYRYQITEHKIGIYHYAKRMCHRRKVLYRDSVSQKQQKDSANIVGCTTPKGQFVGNILYFFRRQKKKNP